VGSRVGLDVFGEKNHRVRILGIDPETVQPTAYSIDPTTLSGL
jgi:hypothetical protein